MSVFSYPNELRASDLGYCAQITSASVACTSHACASQASRVRDQVFGRKRQERWTEDVLEKELSESLQPLARGLFKAAMEAWNFVVPRARIDYQCRGELTLPSMPADPHQVPIVARLTPGRFRV